MEEDAGVKAPVTRLRRRLSVEQTEESKSPAVNTPTKKRGGRKAAKPELELIDENTPDNTTTRRATKKTATKDVAEPEEKTVTPSRRTTRIKSNTSIISETALAVDSPRAKRAARRASTAGSDGEAPITPIRQSRRTRKDSASSVEKEPQLPPKQGIQIAEVIIEEPDGSTIKLTPQPETTTDQSNSPNNTRKSPRLRKINQTTPPKISIDKSSDDIPVSQPATSESKKNSLLSISLYSEGASDNPKSKADIAEGTKIQTQTSQNRLSIASANLIKDLNTEVPNKSNLNKSLSDTESKKSIIKRKRTKSWTTSASNESKVYSDSEIAKNKINNNIKPPLVLVNQNGSGDGSLNESLNKDKSNKPISKKKKKDSLNFTVEDINELSDNVRSIEISIVKESENETISSSQNNTKNDNVITISELLKGEPSGDIKSMVFIEAFDSNSEKVNLHTRHENEDQCVPVVDHPIKAFPVERTSFTSILDKNEQNILHKSKELSKTKDNSSMDCEPMDIDETMPENIITPEIQSPEKNPTGRNSISTSAHISNLSSEEIVNKSRRKPSITLSLDKSEIETKSTLILSQIKDVTGDINNAVKSPQVTNNILLSKSVDDLNITQEIDVKKNVSLHYSTSTPLQDKNIQKFKKIHINTSIISSQNNQSNNTIKDVANMSKDQYNNKDIELSKDDVLKELIYSENKGKNTPKKETIDIQSEIAHSGELKEIMKTDKETLDNKHAFTQQSESESDDVSLHKNSINLSKVKKISKNTISSSEESVEEIESGDDSAEKSNLIDDEALDAGDDYESGDSQDDSERRYEKENEVIDKGETLTTDEEFSDDSDYEKDSFLVSSNEEDEELLDGSDDDLSMSGNELKMTAKSKKKFNERKVKEQKKASREMFASRHRLNSSNKSSNSEIGATKKNERQQINSSESEEDIPIKPKKNNRLRLDSTKEASLLADKNEYKISKKKSKHLPDSDSSSDESVPNEKEMTICNETVKDSDPLSQIKIEPKTPQKSADSTIAFIDSEDVNNDRIDKNESTMTQTELLDPLQANMAAEDDDDSLSSDNENIIQNYDSVLQDLNKSSQLKAKVCDISLNIDNKRKKKVKTAIVDELNLTQVKSAEKPKNKNKEEHSNSVKEILSKTKEDEASSDSIDLHLLFSEDSNNSDTSSLQNQIKNASTISEVIIPLKRTEGKTDVRESKDNKGNEERTSFFIDTVGSHADSLDRPHNISLKGNHNQSSENVDFAMAKLVNKSASETKAIENSDDETPLEISYKKEKVSRRKSKAQDNIDSVTDETDDVAEKSINKSIAKTPASEKKKKNKIKETEILDQTDNIRDTTANTFALKVPNSEKKKKRHSESGHVELSELASDQPLNISQIKTPGSHKRKTGIDSLADNIRDTTANTSPLKVPNSEKKKKRHSESGHVELSELAVDQPLNISQIKTPGSQKIKTGIDSLADNQEVPIETATSEKKKRKSASKSIAVDNENPSVPVEICENIETSTKKRKRKSSLNTTKEEILRLDDSAKALNESLVGSKKKKRKIASQGEIATVSEAVLKEGEHNKKIVSGNVWNDTSGIDEVNKKRNRKRKEREDETTNQTSKTLKQNIFNQVPRLPPTLLEKLDDVPFKEVSTKKPKVISTTQFHVQETKKRKTKPSNYLEESVYLNEKLENKRNKNKRLDKPKVLPFVPTASTSTSGFTTNFKINVLPNDIKFVAQSNTISNFRDNYMYSNRIRRLGTYDLYKRQRNVKLSKF